MRCIANSPLIKDASTLYDPSVESVIGIAVCFTTEDGRAELGVATRIGTEAICIALKEACVVCARFSTVLRYQPLGDLLVLYMKRLLTEVE